MRVMWSGRLDQFAGCTYGTIWVWSELVMDQIRVADFTYGEIGIWSGRVFGSIGVCWLHLRGNRGLVWSDLWMDQSLSNRILVLVGFGKKGVLGSPKMILFGLGSIGVSMTRRPDGAC